MQIAINRTDPSPEINKQKVTFFRQPVFVVASRLIQVELRYALWRCIWIHLKGEITWLNLQPSALIKSWLWDSTQWRYVGRWEPSNGSISAVARRMNTFSPFIEDMIATSGTSEGTWTSRMSKEELENKNADVAIKQRWQGLITDVSNYPE